MRKPLIILALIATISVNAWVTLAYGAAPDQIQYCKVPATSTATGSLVGCPPAQVAWGPVLTTDLVRTQTPAQAWVPYSSLTPTSMVVRKTGGAWVALSSITVTPAPTNPQSGGGGSVTPPPPYSASVTLTWKAPTTNTDGSSLTDLASYNVYMGATAANLLPVGKVTAPTTTFTTSPLTVGSYTFTVTAVNLSGVESAQAALVTTTVSKPSTTPVAPTGLSAVSQ
jgi:hypothetical protein